MIECFVSYYRIDYPECRKGYGVVFDAMQQQKREKCYTTFPVELAQHRIHYRVCTNESCPSQKRVLVFRCELGWLSKEEIERFEHESGINDNPKCVFPKYVFHKGIPVEELPLKERLEHEEAMQRFAQFNEKHCEVGEKIHFKQMKKFKAFAEILIDGRKKEQATIISHLPAEPTRGNDNIPVVIDERFTETIEEAGPIEMYYAAKTHTSEPYETALVVIDPDAQKAMFQANYEAGLALKYADKTDEWHRISNLKYKGKGWADIARVELDQEVQDGKRTAFKQTDIDKKSRNIQNQVETLRKNLGIAESQNEETS